MEETVTQKAIEILTEIGGFDYKENIEKEYPGLIGELTKNIMDTINQY